VGAVEGDCDGVADGKLVGGEVAVGAYVGHATGMLVGEPTGMASVTVKSSVVAFRNPVAPYNAAFSDITSVNCPDEMDAVSSDVRPANERHGFVVCTV
jgi:hypothetical protein